MLNIIRKAKIIIDTLCFRLYVKYHGGHIGHSLSVIGKVKCCIDANGRLEIMNGVTLNSDNSFNPLCRNMATSIYVKKNAILTIGNNTGISSSCLWAKEAIIIGERVAIGAGTIILDNDCHSLNHEIRSGLKRDENGNKVSDSAKSKKVVIENDVMIGANCVILKGVTIGSRSVVGAGSIVAKSIPADCIAGGNPCKVIRFLKYEIDR